MSLAEKGGRKAYDIGKAKDEALARSFHVGQLVEVISFDPQKMTVDVQPLSQVEMEGAAASLPPVLQVPCLPCSFGRFILRPWHEPGDKGYIAHLDHDMDFVLMKGGLTPPNTKRSHSANDAVFIGGIKTDPDPMPAGIPSDSLVLCTKDGGFYISLQDRLLRIVYKISQTGDIDVTGNVSINGNVSVTGDVSVTGSQNISGDLMVGGELGVGSGGGPGAGSGGIAKINGGLLVAGPLFVSEDAKIQGVSFLEHKHMTPAGLSGPPLGAEEDEP